MSKQLVHSKYPVKGKDIPFNFIYSLFCNMIVQFIPLATFIIMTYYHVNSVIQLILIPLVYTVCGGRWTLGYHNLLHQEDDLHPVLDAILGVGFGHLLTFRPGKVAHDSHHRLNYGKDNRKLELDFKDDYLTEEDISYRKKQIMMMDADYWCKCSPNRWVLFIRSAQFDMNYTSFYIKKKKNTKWNYFPMYMSRLILLLAPFLFIDTYIYAIHLVLCRIIMSVIFMVFTTLAHEEGWFDRMVDNYYPFQNQLDINTLLEILIGYHVHHVNEHDNHHIFPKRDVSILANLSISSFLLYSDLFKIQASKPFILPYDYHQIANKLAAISPMSVKATK